MTSHIKVPQGGSKIVPGQAIPDNPIIPFIEGDGIGIDIIDEERCRNGRNRCKRGHGAAILPARALAATTSGLSIWVRIPGPCRPSKLRLVDEITRLPAGKLSPPA